MADDEMSAFVREIVEKVRREVSAVQLRAGTVVSYTPGAVAAQVRLDGDPPDNAVDVTNVTGISLIPGTRILVLFSPPHGGYIIGNVGGTSAPCARTQIEYTKDGQEVYEWSEVQVAFNYEVYAVAGATTHYNYIQVPTEGIYSATCSIRADFGPSNIIDELHNGVGFYLEIRRDNRNGDGYEEVLARSPLYFQTFIEDEPYAYGQMIGNVSTAGFGANEGDQILVRFGRMGNGGPVFIREGDFSVTWEAPGSSPAVIPPAGSV